MAGILGFIGGVAETANESLDALDTAENSIIAGTTDTDTAKYKNWRTNTTQNEKKFSKKLDNYYDNLWVDKSAELGFNIFKPSEDANKDIHLLNMLNESMKYTEDAGMGTIPGSVTDNNPQGYYWGDYKSNKKLMNNFKNVANLAVDNLATPIFESYTNVAGETSKVKIKTIPQTTQNLLQEPWFRDKVNTLSKETRNAFFGKKVSLDSIDPDPNNPYMMFEVTNSYKPSQVKMAKRNMHIAYNYAVFGDRYPTKKNADNTGWLLRGWDLNARKGQFSPTLADAFETGTYKLHPKFKSTYYPNGIRPGDKDHVIIGDQLHRLAGEPYSGLQRSSKLNHLLYAYTKTLNDKTDLPFDPAAEPFMTEQGPMQDLGLGRFVSFTGKALNITGSTSLEGTSLLETENKHAYQSVPETLFNSSVTGESASFQGLKIIDDIDHILMKLSVVGSVNDLFNILEGFFGQTGGVNQIGDIFELFNSRQAGLSERLIEIGKKVMASGDQNKIDAFAIMRNNIERMNTDAAKEMNKWKNKNSKLMDVNVNSKVGQAELQRVTQALLPMLSTILTYQIAMAVQGGTGGRTISDQDFMLISKVLAQKKVTSVAQNQVIMRAARRFLEKRYIESKIIREFGKEGTYGEIINLWLGDNGIYEKMAGRTLEAGLGESRSLPYMKELLDDKEITKEEYDEHVATMDRARAYRLSPTGEKEGIMTSLPRFRVAEARGPSTEYTFSKGKSDIPLSQRLERLKKEE